MGAKTKLVLIFLVMPMFAYGHEETCTFIGRLKNIKKSTRRAPQADTVLITADVNVVEAKSRAGVLSYLDCKHWQNESLPAVEIAVKQNIAEKIEAGESVTIDFYRRGSGEDEKTAWNIISSDLN